MAASQFGLIWLADRLPEWVMSLQPESVEDVRMVEQASALLRVNGIVFFAVNLLLPLLPKRPWAYFVHLGNALAAIVLICPAALAIPVLATWQKPEMRQFFGLRP